MAAVIPQKRATISPPTTDVDPLLSPTLSKQPRFDATSTLPSDPASTEVKVQGYKTPKMFKDMGTWGPTEMGAMETTYLSTQFEVDDSSEYKEALLALEGLTAKSAHPTRQHVRQVLALCFFPLFFKPPTRVSAFARATAGSSSSSSASKPILAPFDQDPFNLSHKKLREEARKLLDDLINTNGMDAVCRSIKGYGMPKLETRTKAIEDPFASPAPTTSSTSAAAPPSPPPAPAASKSRNPKVVAKKGKTVNEKSKAKAAAGSDSDDLQVSDSDDVLLVSAKRIGKTENLWDFLAGTAARKQKVWTREQPVLDGGWEILRSLVDGWEGEWEEKKKLAFSSDSPIQPLSLLRYFKPSATSRTARELSAKAFDVAFWPFTDAALPRSELDHDDSSAESDASDLFSDEANYKSKGKGKATARTQTTGRSKKEEAEVKFEGGMSLEEKKEVGIRLLCLIGDSATVGHFDATATLGEFVQRMKALDHSRFPSFLELLSIHASPASPFLSRLLAAYLETHSHPLSASVSLDVPSLATLSSSTLASSSSSDLLTSPRKRALAAQNSMASVNDPSSSSQTQSQGVVPLTPSQTPAEVEAEFWKTPQFDSKDFLTLVSRIPIEVPIPLDSTAGEGGGGARKPKGTLGSFERSERAAECHRLVKEVLIERKVDDSGYSRVDSEERNGWTGRIQRVLAGVEQVVDQARMRAEKK